MIASVSQQEEKDGQEELKEIAKFVWHHLKDVCPPRIWEEGKGVQDSLAVRDCKPKEEFLVKALQ